MAKKKEAEVIETAEIAETNPFCIPSALRALAGQARERSDAIAQSVHPNNVFPLTLNALAAQLDDYAALMEERGHDGIPLEVSE